MNENYSNWGQEEFLTFVLIHAALADFEIQEEEHEIIAGLIPSHRFRNILKFHKKNSDFDNINVIMDLKNKFCNSDEARQKLFREIKSVFHSDGRYNLHEKNMDRALNLILAS
jgi:hypothetical protein